MKLKVKSWTMLTFASFFTGVMGYVLFQDVIYGGLATINSSHVLTLGAIVAAIASGLTFWPALTDRQLILAVALIFLNVASVGYIVVGSGSRNAETAENKTAMIAEANRLREEEQKQLEKSLAMLKREQAELAKECRTGKGSKCKGSKESVAVYERAVEGSRAALARLGPPRSAEGGYDRAAKLFAMMPGISASEERIKEQLTQLIPFVAVLISELAVIIFWKLGLTFEWKMLTVSEIETPVFTREIDGNREIEKSTLTKSRPFVYRESEHEVIEALRRSATPLSNRDLALALGCSEAEASRRWREVRERLEVRREGKFLALTLRS